MVLSVCQISSASSREAVTCFASINRLIYNEMTKVEWDKQFKDYNCELLEDNEMPYVDGGKAFGGKAVVVVIRKL